jgi:pimeloyl-ACP methyl ester carboxylesterase
MLSIKKEDITLAYTDEGSSTTVAPMVLIHGWGCDHTSLKAQAEYFSRTRRVISLDLRGHGESDAPSGDYTMASYAADVAWLCTALALHKPVMVGHSMGGSILLELSARYPETPGSIVLIDSVLFPSEGSIEASAPLISALAGPEFASAYRSGISKLHLTTDEIAAHDSVFASLPRAPQHVLAASLIDHVIGHDVVAAASGCKVPVAYISSAHLLADLEKLTMLTPQVVTAQVLGAGHFSPVLVPDQINAMLARFAALSGLL